MRLIRVAGDLAGYQWNSTLTICTWPIWGNGFARSCERQFDFFATIESDRTEWGLFAGENARGGGKCLGAREAQGKPTSDFAIVKTLAGFPWACLSCDFEAMLLRKPLDRIQ